MIYFSSFSKQQDINYFVRNLQKQMKYDRKNKTIEISMANDFFSTPEVIAPISGLLDYIRGIGYKITINFNGNKLKSSGIEYPFTVENNSYDLLSPMYKVWKYSTPEEVSAIVTALIKALDTRVVCAKGVVEAFEWTVNEVMDNVIQHSQSEYGFVICTVTNNAHISVSVYDNGIGILRSFYGSEYRLKSPYDAIALAMQEGATRDKKIGQGNGLWGMSKLVSNNKGNLGITSSGARLAVDENNAIHRNDDITRFNLMGDTFIPGTLVDFQFQCNNPVSFSEIFGKQYVFTNIYIESMEDEKDRILLRVKDFSFGYSTRLAGENARNMAINFATQTEEKQIILIDLQGIGIMASSFADEFIGKLACYYGFIQFNNLFRIINVSKENMAIINRSVMQRMKEELDD